MGNNIMKLDANESIFFKRELEYVKKKTYDKKYKNLRANIFIPVSTEAQSGAETITWKKFSKVGQAKIISDYATDFPRADAYGEEVTTKVKGIGSAYGYSIKEIRRAQLAGRNLQSKKSEAARFAIESKQDSIAWNGDSDSGLQGFIDYPGITEATLTTGTSGNTWALKTPDEIIADLSAIKSAVSVPTSGKENIDTIIVPIEQYEIILNKRMTGNSDVTVLKFFLNNNTDVALEAVDELAGKGAAGAQRIMGYVRDVDHLEQQIPQMFEMFDPDKKGMEYEIPCHAEHGGVTIYYPASVCFMDGV